MVRKTVIKRQAVLVLLILVSVAMLTWYFREPDDGLLHASQRGGLRLISPLESGISVIITPFRDAYGWMASLVNARGENEELHREVEQLRGQLVALREADAENRRLRSMLGILDQPFYPDDYGHVAARVVGRSASAWNATITINRGSDDGIAMGQTVVNGEGLVGQVSAVAGNSAQVLLIVDNTSRVEAKVQSSQAQGTVIGSVNGMLEMDFVEKEAKVEENDVVVTSGTGRLFVKGVPIGVVSGVSDQEVDYFKRIAVTPFVDFDRLEEVLVLIPPAGADQVPLVEEGR